MPPKYTLFVDESGDMGIQKIRSDSTSGASPYMVLGAVMVENSLKENLCETLKEIQKEIGKETLHCKTLEHRARVYFAQQISGQDVILFGLISTKKTLRTYREHIGGDPKKYYNKCAQYLLERVGMFMQGRGIEKDDLRIIFEKANVDYKAMRNYISTCRENPKHIKTTYLRYINPALISPCKKNEEPLLQIADLLAHALYQCVHKTDQNHKITETRYLKELSPRFFGNPENDLIVGWGIYCIHEPDDLGLDKNDKEFLENLRSNTFTKTG